jgi:hypothetical protein
VLPPDLLHIRAIKPNGRLLGSACLQGGNQNSLFRRETQEDTRDLLSTKEARTRRVDIGAWCPMEFLAWALKGPDIINRLLSAGT